MKSREQLLIDMLFNTMMLVTDGEHSHRFMNMTNELKAEWVTKQLTACGFNVRPQGASWGVLDE